MATSVIPIHDENPVSSVPFVTYGLIASCIGVFVYQAYLAGEDVKQLDLLVEQYGVVPAALFSDNNSASEILKSLLPLWTSAFLHGGLFHLAGNVLFLWIFGNNVEDAMGHGRYLVFYLLASAASMLAQALPDVSSEIPIIGASGAISGVLGAYLLLFPTARVTLLFWLIIIIRTFKLPAAIVLIAWFGFQLVSTFIQTNEESGGVAFDAHIGGFLAGMLMVAFFRSRDFAIYNPITAIIQDHQSRNAEKRDDSAIS